MMYLIAISYILNLVFEFIKLFNIFAKWHITI
jgi:hypothetical protein